MIRSFKVPWGMSTTFNVYNCSPLILQSKPHIKRYVLTLCDLIDMKRYGPCKIVKFGTGDKEGFSFFQLIETSNISGHIAEKNGTLYVDIFSCKKYLPQMVSNFTMDFFKAKDVEFKTTTRY